MLKQITSDKMILPKEERKVLSVLSRYGCLSQEQVVEYLRLNADLSCEKAEQIVSGLWKRHVILQAKGCYKISPNQREDENLMLSFWLFVRLLGSYVGADDHYRTSSKGAITAVCKNRLYHILYLAPGREADVAQLLTESNLSEPKHYPYLCIGYTDPGQLETIKHYLGTYLQTKRVNIFQIGCAKNENGDVERDLKKKVALRRVWPQG